MEMRRTAMVRDFAILSQVISLLASFYCLMFLRGESGWVEEEAQRWEGRGRGHTFLGHCGYMVSRSFEGDRVLFLGARGASSCDGWWRAERKWSVLDFEQFLAERAERKEFKGQLINFAKHYPDAKTTITWIRTVTINLGRPGRLIDWSERKLCSKNLHFEVIGLTFNFLPSPPFSSLPVNIRFWKRHLWTFRGKKNSNRKQKHQRITRG